ncbi:MAG: endolytic transglycosylase MltG [Acutalibacteraceae bacterium]
MQDNNGFNNDLFKRSDENLNSSDEQFKTKIFDNSVDKILSEINNENTYSNISDDFMDSEKNSETEFENVEDKVKRKSRKKRKKMPTFLKVLIILLISFGLAAVIIFSAIDVLGIVLGEDKVAEVDVKQGFSTEQIANELHENGVIKFPVLFRLYSKFKGADGNYQYGVYEIKDSQSYDSIINALKQPGETGNIVTVTIPEGYSVQKIGDLLEKKGVCTKSEFISAVKNAEYDYDFIKDIPTQSVYYRLEGYLYPDTYQLFANTDGNSGEECAKKAVNKMLSEMNNLITDDVKNTAKKRGYSVHEILTMASIVELEASGYPDEMAKVAQVFYNRLNWTDEPNMLGSTPTSDYVDSRYDTNKYEGLPPGPLCSPSKEALNAALNPDTSVKADYFVTDKNMKFYYTNSLEEHNELIQNLKSEGLWD